MFANANVNSPLRFDTRMLESMLEYSAAGQAVLVTPFLLMGAMAPVTIAAALAQQTAEVLTGISLLQLVRPGQPVDHGQLPLLDRHAVRLARVRRPRVGARPYASGQIARRYGLPWRAGGGALTTSQTVDAQAGSEAFNTLISAFLAGANVVWQARRLARGRPRQLLREVRDRRRDAPAPARRSSRRP